MGKNSWYLAKESDADVLHISKNETDLPDDVPHAKLSQEPTDSSIWVQVRHGMTVVHYDDEDVKK